MKLMLCISVLFAYLSTIAGQTYKAEGLFVVDKEVVKSYMREIPGNRTAKRLQAKRELHQDIKYTISEVNKLFASLQPRLTIKIYVKNIIMESARFNIYPSTSMRANSSNAINGMNLLEKFDIWLHDNNTYAPHNYDFALLWTGFDIYGEDGQDSTGSAHLGKMCDLEKATGVGEFNKTYATVLTTTRLIALLLGSNYGGPASHGIMSPTMDPHNINRWLFSNSSINDIEGWLRSNLATDQVSRCLLTTNPNSTKPTLRYGSYTGQMLDVDTICRRYRNRSIAYMMRAYRYHNHVYPSGDNVCKYIPCHTSAGGPHFVVAYASEGMVCDVGKRCQRGLCVPDSTAPTNITSNCVFGNQPTEAWFPGFTCERNADCYNHYEVEICCGTCNARYIGMEGCPYGDRSRVCRRYPKASKCVIDDDVKMCCYYCRGINATNPTRIPNYTLYASIEDNHE